MRIDDAKTVAEIQGEFSSLFEGLKIEFYKVGHADHKGSKKEDQYPSSKVLADIRTTHQSGDLVIDDKMSTAELEEAFETKFGLNVQVFRKSGNIWLQTSATDDWSLAKQNEKGMNFPENQDINLHNE